MNDITILDLFWFILKLLSAVALVGLIGLLLFMVWAGAKRVARVSWDILRGRDASVAATVCFVIGLVVLVTCMVLAVGYINGHPNFLHP
jgi:hypothetical protein